MRAHLIATLYGAVYYLQVHYFIHCVCVFYNYTVSAVEFSTVYIIAKGNIVLLENS